MPKHIARLIVLLGVLGAAGLAAKSYFTAGSFYRYGHYRGNAVAEIASDRPKYENTESCGSCHAERYAEWSHGVHDSASIHKVVKCEVCHGAAGRPRRQRHVPALGERPAAPGQAQADRPDRHAQLCTRCHSKDPARPAEQRQIAARRARRIEAVLELPQSPFAQAPGRRRRTRGAARRRRRGRGEGCAVRRLPRTPAA